MRQKKIKNAINRGTPFRERGRAGRRITGSADEGGAGYGRGKALAINQKGSILKLVGLEEESIPG